MGGIEGGAEDNRRAGPGPGIGNLGEDDKAEERGPDKPQEIERHDGGGIRFLEGLGKREVPDAWTWIGGTVIFGSATYIAFREARRRQEKPEGGVMQT